mgnify:FL=1
MIVSQMPKTNKKRREMQIMDLIKIGKYISGKRKELGLTQKQLAEKLDKSDKSVSKWERGICLPDVSVYMELCSILNITINEFLASSWSVFYVIGNFSFPMHKKRRGLSTLPRSQASRVSAI